MSDRITGAAIDARLLKLGNGWQVWQGHLNKVYVFDNFVDGVAFVGKAAEVAEAAEHHPELTVRWGQVQAEIWTHSAGGLTEKDFSLAAKLDAI